MGRGKVEILRHKGTRRMNESTYHVPVLVEEVIRAMGIERGKEYIDATLGGGGYTKEILKCGGRVLAIDQDPDAIDNAKKTLEKEFEHEQVQCIQGNFREIRDIAKRKGFNNIKGIVFDLGVSSHQLDTPERGFSYRYSEANLDMRFDNRSSARGAEEIVNTKSEEELYEIFVRFGEEQLARPIAHALIRARKIRPIEKIEDIQKSRSMLGRVYQSLRIAVNDELGSLRQALSDVPKMLGHGGILAVVSYHSLEDRIVKQCMRGNIWKSVTKKPIRPTETEMERNPRSRSAKARIAKYL